MRRYGEGQTLAALRELDVLERGLQDRLRTHPREIDTHTMAGNFELTFAGVIPVGKAQRLARTEAMVETMEEYFGACTNHGECQEACPKEIPIDLIAYMNRDYVKAELKNRSLTAQS